MRQILTKICPLVDFEEEVGQINVGDTAANLFVEGLHTFGYVFRLIHGNDELAILDTDAIASVQYPIHTWQQVFELLGTGAQTGLAGGIELELLADICPEL